MHIQCIYTHRNYRGIFKYKMSQIKTANLTIEHHSQANVKLSLWYEVGFRHNRIGYTTTKYVTTKCNICCGHNV